MSLVASLVDTATEQLSAAGESQFGLTAGAVGTILQVGATLAIIFVCINALMQFRPLPIGDALILIVKLLLIAQFATVWSQFDAVASAVISGMNSIAGAMLGGGDSLAAAFDDMLDRLATSANTTLDQLGTFSRAMMSAIFFILNALTAAVAGLILIFALVMITVHIGMAPIFIGLSIFKSTSDYFFLWLKSTLSYTLYPVVIAAVLGSMIRLTQGVVDALDPTNVATLGALVPFFAILIIMIATILLIPMIVTGLSGTISAAGPLAAAAVAAGAYRNLAGSAAAGKAMKSMFSGRGSPPAPPGGPPGAGAAAPAARQQAQQNLQRQMSVSNRHRNRP